MRITPMDIRQQQFTVRMFRGFDVQEVDTFLEDLAGDYEAMLKENTLLKEHLQAAEERTRGLEQRERMLQETLVTTQRMVEEMKDNARREAQLVIKEAEMQGEKTIEAARTAEAAIQAADQPAQAHAAAARRIPASHRGHVPAPAGPGSRGRCEPERVGPEGAAPPSGGRRAPFGALLPASPKMDCAGGARARMGPNYRAASSCCRCGSSRRRGAMKSWNSRMGGSAFG